MPAKKKGKKTKKQESGTDVLTEVDKTFYELQITDLNRKLARLKLTSQEIEDKNQYLEKKLEHLDEDRADVISYLKRMVETKQNEALELEERVTALEETKESEGKEFEEKIEELQLENKTIKEQLTSENKLLTGKLNALEEFRILRDDLMKKFEEQEKTIEEQEIKEKKKMYEIEKKFIISKKNIASEMERELFNLANNFEKANETRIAATTQRCIRENIVLNKELNKMISNLENLNQQVEKHKSKNIELKLNCELYQEERNSTISELQVVRAHLHQLTQDFESRVKILRTYEGKIKQSEKTYEDLKHALARETELAAKIRILEQNLHSTRCKETDLKQLLLKQNKLVKHFQQINHEAIIAIEDCLKITLHPRMDKTKKKYSRELLLQNLLTILTNPKIESHSIVSMETIDSIENKYKRGDLGFLPKEVQYAKDNIQVLNAAVQVTPRFEEEAISPRYSSIENDSNITSATLERSYFQACSLYGSHNKSYSILSPDEVQNFIEELQIEQLSATEIIKSNESDNMLIDSEGSKERILETIENIEDEIENEAAVIEITNAEEKETTKEQDEIVEEEEEATLFDMDEDEIEILSSSND